MAATFTLKYGRTSVHVAGAEIRTQGTDFDYAKSACPVLSRSVRFCERAAQATTAAEVIEEAKKLAVATSNKLCKKCLEALEAMAATEAAEAEAAAAPAGRTPRAAQGVASVAGWELLYDKPKQGAEVGRRSVEGRPQYALICKAHGHAHELPRLTAERALRSNGGWCPSC